MGDVQKMRFWCQKVLPLVYDDSLSYYETLCKFLQKLNEVIDLYNNIQENFEGYVDQEIDKLKNYVDSENTKQNDEFDEKIEAIYQEIQTQVNRLFAYINNGDLILKNYIDKKILDLKEWVEDAIIGNIIIYDPTTGYNNPLDVVMTHIYDALRYWGITCYQFDVAENTCNQLDGYHYTALEFDTNSLQILGKYYPHYIFNPIDGNYDSVQRVLYQWFQYHRENAIICNTFDGLEKDVTTLDGIDYTAYSFDETAKTILPS